MSSFSASSVPKTQNWRNELLMKPADPVPLTAADIFNDSIIQKYSGIQSMQHQAAYQNQKAQGGYQGQQGQGGYQGGCQAGYQGQQGQGGYQGQQGLSGFQNQQGRPILANQQNQQGGGGMRSPQGRGYSGQSGQSGRASQSPQPGQAGSQMLAGVCCEQANCDQTKIEHIYPEQYMHEPATPFTLLQPPTDGSQAGPKDGSPGEQLGMFGCPCGLNRGQLVTICCTGKDCDDSTKIDDIHMGPPEEKRAKTAFNQFKF